MKCAPTVGFYWDEPTVHHALVNLRHHARLLSRQTARFLDCGESQRARMNALRKMEFSADQHQQMVQAMIVLAQAYGMIQRPADPSESEGGTP